MISHPQNQSSTNLHSRQSGVYIVEFAIVGFVALLVLFGTIEVSRAMFTLNMLEEATRRGARVAAVCTVDNPAITRAAVFNASGAGNAGKFLPNLTTANIQVQYLDGVGVPITDYASDDDRYMDIEYVRVQIVNYEHKMIVPGFDLSFQTRPYATTIPRESLGVTRTNLSTCT